MPQRSLAPREGGFRGNPGRRPPGRRRHHGWVVTRGEALRPREERPGRAQHRRARGTQALEEGPRGARVALGRRPGEGEPHRRRGPRGRGGRRRRVRDGPDVEVGRRVLRRPRDSRTATTGWRTRRDTCTGCHAHAGLAHACIRNAQSDVFMASQGVGRVFAFDAAVSASATTSRPSSWDDWPGCSRGIRRPDDAFAAGIRSSSTRGHGEARSRSRTDGWPGCSQSGWSDPSRDDRPSHSSGARCSDDAFATGVQLASTRWPDRLDSFAAPEWRPERTSPSFIAEADGRTERAAPDVEVERR
jgi:hypothetical protein